MSSQNFLKERPYLYAILSVIALITFYPLFFTGIATADDLHYCIIAQRGIVWEDTLLFAKLNGRFYFYIVKVFFSIAFFVNDPLFTKTLHFLPVFLCILVFWRLLKLISESDALPALFFLLFMVTMQISRHTSLFVAYPFYFSFSFFLLLWSYYQLLVYLKKGRKRHWIASIILFALGLLFYEPYLLFVLFAALAIGAAGLNASGPARARLKQALIRITPYILVALAYLAAYIIFRMVNPSQYSGSALSEKPIGFTDFFYVVWRLSLSAFPLTIYETSHHIFWEKSELIQGYSPVLLNLILSAKVEWLAKGFLVAFAGYRLLRMLEGTGLRKTLIWSGIAVLLIFLPHFPLALTEKYHYYVNYGSMIGYITTYFSFFGVLLLIIAWISFLMGKLNGNPYFKAGTGVLLAFGFFLCSVLTDFSNYTIAKDIRSANLRIFAMDDLIQTDQFRAIPGNSPIYARTMYDSPSISAPNITEQEFNWFEYFDARTRKFFPVGRVDSTFIYFASRSTEAPWYLTMRQAAKSEAISIVMAKIPRVLTTDTLVSHFADTAVVLYRSAYKAFTVSFRIRDLQPIKAQIGINHIKEQVNAEGRVEITIYNTKKGKASTIFTLAFPGIDLTSVMISDMVNEKNPVFYL